MLVRVLRDVLERLIEVRRVDREMLEVVRLEELDAAEEVLQVKVVDQHRFVCHGEIEPGVRVVLEPLRSSRNEPLVLLLRCLVVVGASFVDGQKRPPLETRRFLASRRTDPVQQDAASSTDSLPEAGPNPPQRRLVLRRKPERFSPPVRVVERDRVRDRFDRAPVPRRSRRRSRDIRAVGPVFPVLIVLAFPGEVALDLFEDRLVALFASLELFERDDQSRG